MKQVSLLVCNKQRKHFFPLRKVTRQKQYPHCMTHVFLGELYDICFFSNTTLFIQLG
jgi:hypothetical protein